MLKGLQVALNYCVLKSIIQGMIVKYTPDSTSDNDVVNTMTIKSYDGGVMSTCTSAEITNTSTAISDTKATAIADIETFDKKPMQKVVVF
jgi:hypothetical protein